MKYLKLTGKKKFTLIWKNIRVNVKIWKLHKDKLLINEIFDSYNQEDEEGEMS